MSEFKPFTLTNDVPYQALNDAHQADAIKAQGGDIPDKVKQTPTEEQLYPTTQVQADNLNTYRQEAQGVNGNLQNAFNLESRVQGKVLPDGNLEASEFDVRTGGNTEVEGQLKDKVSETVVDFLIDAKGDEKTIAQGLGNVGKAVAKGLEMGAINENEATTLKNGVTETVGLRVVENVSSGSMYLAKSQMEELDQSGLLTPEGKAQVQARTGEIVGTKVSSMVEGGTYYGAKELVERAEQTGFLTPQKKEELLRIILNAQQPISV